MVLLVPAVTAAAKRHGAAFAALVAAFAAGALLSCAFNLLLFESSHLIAVGYTEEKEVTWRWGTMILSGFLVSTVVDCIISFFADPHPPATAAPPLPAAPLPPAAPAQLEDRSMGKQGTSLQPTAAESHLVWSLENQGANLNATPPQPEGACVDSPGCSVAKVAGAEMEAGDTNRPQPVERASLRERARLIGGVLIGDFFHNLCDGVFIGAAFSTCSPAMGWSVSSATVIHEVAQELSDFSILTSPSQGALGTALALALNFVSGLSVVIGVLAVLGSGVTDESAGLILAFGGGVYIHVGAAECMPRVYRLQVNPHQL